MIRLSHESQKELHLHSSFSEGGRRGCFYNKAVNEGWEKGGKGGGGERILPLVPPFAKGKGGGGKRKGGGSRRSRSLWHSGADEGEGKKKKEFPP